MAGHGVIQQRGSPRVKPGVMDRIAQVPNGATRGVWYMVKLRTQLFMALSIAEGRSHDLSLYL